MYSAISVYPGLDVPLQDYYDYLASAKQNNIKYVFMSLHIKEANNTLLKEFEFLLDKINQLKLQAIVDISKQVYDNIKLDIFKIYGLRLDYGFDETEIIALSKQNKYKIFLNASTISEHQFKSMLEKGLSIKNISMFHNFYPKPYSGLSKEYVNSKNNYYKSQNIQTLTFIKSDYKLRQPLFKGLPTIEEHRHYDIYDQLNELLMMQTDIVCVGDLMASDKELQIMSSYIDGCIKFKLTINKTVYADYKDILAIEHISRQDKSLYVIRSETSRFAEFAKQTIKPHNNDHKINIGSVSIDNILNKRYNGELNIWLKPVANIPEINLIGEVHLTNWMLANSDKIDKFKFLIEEE